MKLKVMLTLLWLTPNFLFAFFLTGFDLPRSSFICGCLTFGIVWGVIGKELR
jgi:hypothetical protein